MFKFLKRRGFLRDDNASDIISESANINVSDSAPILNRNFDLLNAGGSSSYIHDLRRSIDPEGSCETIKLWLIDIIISYSFCREFKVSTVKRSLRTIPGVFFPVALSMCSVAVFMRIGFIVGFAGVYDSLGIYALAFAIFVLTGLSVCAISTNGAIQGGGVYCKLNRQQKNFVSFYSLVKNLILRYDKSSVGSRIRRSDWHFVLFCQCNR